MISFEFNKVAVIIELGGRHHWTRPSSLLDYAAVTIELQARQGVTIGLDA